MSALKNPRHERFAQNVAHGMNATDAYLDAGFKASAQAARRNGSRLLTYADIAARVDAIKAFMIDQITTRVLISRERVLEELAKIAFADIRKAVQWFGDLTTEELEQIENGDERVVRHIYSNHVKLINSDKLDDATAAAISEVRQSPTGGLSIKFHDKQAALGLIGKELGLFVERREIGRPGDFEHMDDEQLRRFVHEQIATAQRGARIPRDRATRRSRQPA